MSHESKNDNLTALLHDSGWALNMLEEKLSNHLSSDQFGVGDIMLKHVSFKQRAYGVWLLCMEDGTVRAYDTYEECSFVHQYRGLPVKDIMDLDDRTLTAEKIEKMLKAVEHIKQGPPDFSKVYRPKNHVKISTISSPDPGAGFISDIHEKIRQKIQTEFFGTTSKEGKL